MGLGTWSLTRDLTDGAAWAGVAGLFCGFAQAALSAASYLRRSEASWRDAEGLADNLAQIVQAEWLGEVAARHLRDPKVLPLSWTSTRGDLDERPHRVVRDRLAGRMDGRFDDVVVQLADGYRRIPSGRLVIVGEPGAGKTVLAMLLTLGLLKARASGAPVPVLLAASSWDPVREGLDDWVVRTLADSYYAGRSVGDPTPVA
ncbi:hypothetical protein [Phytohabitans rumicis]|uniref:NACHT domain-containing protein n=1 Tax=Phytohabitans rumicis TaxID=1076125 RepID=A0A6V8KXP2_9ACTN|nr:hypothetical protein [Phytohabitans rumicis]GFJ87089.1 hypothetical protein Prum_007310 [Phytohabitans rumicis]GFJ87667.1 hypothetical protein Prum_013090 [Phytohabitans rumicis]